MCAGRRLRGQLDQKLVDGRVHAFAVHLVFRVVRRAVEAVLADDGRVRPVDRAARRVRGHVGRGTAGALPVRPDRGVAVRGRHRARRPVPAVPDVRQPDGRARVLRGNVLAQPDHVRVRDAVRAVLLRAVRQVRPRQPGRAARRRTRRAALASRGPAAAVPVGRRRRTAQDPAPIDPRGRQRVEPRVRRAPGHVTVQPVRHGHVRHILPGELGAKRLRLNNDEVFSVGAEKIPIL